MGTCRLPAALQSREPAFVIRGALHSLTPSDHHQLDRLNLSRPLVVYGRHPIAAGDAQTPVTPPNPIFIGFRASMSQSN